MWGNKLLQWCHLVNECKVMRKTFWVVKCDILGTVSNGELFSRNLWSLDGAASRSNVSFRLSKRRRCHAAWANTKDDLVLRSIVLECLVPVVQCPDAPIEVGMNFRRTEIGGKPG